MINSYFLSFLWENTSWQYLHQFPKDVTFYACMQCHHLMSDIGNACMHSLLETSLQYIDVFLLGGSSVLMVNVQIVKTHRKYWKTCQPILKIYVHWRASTQGGNLTAKQIIFFFLAKTVLTKHRNTEINKSQWQEQLLI